MAGRAPWCARSLIASERSSNRCAIRGSGGASRRRGPRCAQPRAQPERQPKRKEHWNGLGQLSETASARSAPSIAIGHVERGPGCRRRERLALEARAPIRKCHEAREPLAEPIAADVLEAPLPHLRHDEREVRRDHQPAEQLHFCAELDRNVEHHPEPQGQSADARKPDPERNEEFASDRSFRRETREPGGTQERNRPRGKGDPMSCKDFGGTKKAQQEHLPAAPISVEELAAGRTEVNERYLQLEEPARERGCHALLERQSVRSPAHEQKRAIARREREQEAEQQQRIAVVVILQAITEQKIKTQARRGKQRFTRPATEEREERGERLDTQQQAISRAVGDPCLRDQRHVKEIGEVAALREFEDQTQSVEEEQRADRQAQHAEDQCIAFLAEESLEGVAQGSHGRSACTRTWPTSRPFFSVSTSAITASVSSSPGRWSTKSASAA